MKPELTFRRSLRLIMKRWWVMALCGVLVAMLAFVFVHSRKAHYTVSTKLTVQDVLVQPKIGRVGYDVLPNPPKFNDAWVTTDFIDPQAAAVASHVLGGSPSADQIIGGLTMTGLTTSTVELDYAGGSNSDEAFNALKQYSKTLLAQRADRQAVAVQQAYTQDQNQFNQLSVDDQKTTQGLRLQQNMAALTTALKAIPGNFSSTFDSARSQPQPQKVAPGGPPLVVAVFGGFLAGVAFGALLALFLGRLDTRVRRPEDIEVSGVPVVDIDSDTDAASVQLLRSELELAGVGTRLGVIAVTRPTRAEGSSGLALALARTFAGVGTPTILVSADLRARSVRPEPGVSGLLDGSITQAPIVKLDHNLGWLPEGSSDASPETLFSAPRVERIIRDLRDQAGVVVIDTPAVLEDSEALPLLACSDIVLLAVRPGRTSWNPLGSAVALIQRVAKRPMHICYDRAQEASSVPAMATRRSDVTDRVAQAIEVPAGS